MKVLFQSRTNLYSAPGGDLVQIQKTKQYLEKLGVEVDISIDLEPDLSKYDLVHLFNLMEPQDIYVQFKNAQKQNKKIALSTIYGLYTEFERKSRGGFFQLLANVLSPYQIGYIKTIVRHFKEKRMHKGVYKMMHKGYYNMMKEISNHTDVFLPNSHSEMKRVASDFKLSNYNYVAIPNALDISLFNENNIPQENPYAKYKDCILCVARIEGRKATLNLVKAVKNTNYQLVLVGKASSNQKKYVTQVQNEAGSNVHFIGAVPHEKLPLLYDVAKVHALVSWMETPGLSSLEAAAMGCNIVVTKKGDTYEYFGEDAFYCEPDDVASIKKAIDKAYQSDTNTSLLSKVKKNYNWEITAKETLAAYQKIMK